MSEPIDMNKLAREAAEQFRVFLNIGRHGWKNTPVEDKLQTIILAALSKLAAEKDADIARHKAALKVATDALKIIPASKYYGSVAKNAITAIAKELKP